MSSLRRELSSYAEGLSKEAKARYKDKIALIDGIDPFGKVTAGESYAGILPVEECDLVSYLVLQTSYITMSQFKARKGLEAYNQFVCGWIKDVQTRKIAGKYVTTGRVSCYLYCIYDRIYKTNLPVYNNSMTPLTASSRYKFLCRGGGVRMMFGYALVFNSSFCHFPLRHL